MSNELEFSHWKLEETQQSSVKEGESFKYHFRGRSINRLNENEGERRIGKNDKRGQPRSGMHSNYCRTDEGGYDIEI